MSITTTATTTPETNPASERNTATGESLNATDYEKLAARWIDRDTADAAGLRRVDDATGAQLLGRRDHANYSGIAIPNLWPGMGYVREWRVRRDQPDANGGRKYLGPPCVPNRLYVPPGTDEALLANPAVPIVVTEGEFKALALTRLARHGLRPGEPPRFVPIAVSGVWNWLTRDAAATPDGGVADTSAPIVDLARVTFQERRFVIAFDSDAAQKPGVAAAQKRLGDHLRQQSARVSFFPWPDDVDLSVEKGIDDLIVSRGPDAVLSLIEPALREKTTSDSSNTAGRRASTLGFPAEGLVGSLGDFARVMADGTEVPEELYWAAAVTHMGAIVGRDLTLDIGCDVDPRLYTVLLGESSQVKKSTAARRTQKFFADLNRAGQPQKIGWLPTVVQGAGSAEGLARHLNGSKNVVLQYDEMQTFVAKCSIKGSALLEVVTTLFECGDWDNELKSAKQSVSVRDARLSLLGCCTIDTWRHIWSPKALDIGLVNRLFVVNADRKVKVAWPAPPDPGKLAAVKQRIEVQLGRLPMCYSIDGDAKALWEAWYIALPENSPHIRRLDTIGFRLLGLLALTTDKNSIDVATVRAVTAVLDYELKLRRETDPIDAENTIAQLEERIRRVLENRGPLSARDLRRSCNADRAGLWAFNQAITNLTKARDIQTTAQGAYQLTAPS